MAAKEHVLSDRYIKGFNSGYILQKHEPDLLKSITQAKNRGSDYLEGIAAGAKQYRKECY
ncbi:MAG: hypothetical protein ACQUHE_11125 [Bacteroidia bacterium]